MDEVWNMYSTALRTRDSEDVAAFIASDRDITNDEHFQAMGTAGFSEMYIAVIRVFASRPAPQEGRGAASPRRRTCNPEMKRGLFGPSRIRRTESLGRFGVG
jgi:hypothetical protein